jgi:hypothetical protein
VDVTGQLDRGADDAVPLARRRSPTSGHDPPEDQHDRQVEQNGHANQVRHDPRGDQHDRQVEQNHQAEQVRRGPPRTRAGGLMSRCSRRLDRWCRRVEQAPGEPSIRAGETVSPCCAEASDRRRSGLPSHRACPSLVRSRTQCEQPRVGAVPPVHRVRVALVAPAASHIAVVTEHVLRVSGGPARLEHFVVGQHSSSSYAT